MIAAAAAVVTTTADAVRSTTCDVSVGPPKCPLNRCTIASPRCRALVPHWSNGATETEKPGCGITPAVLITCPISRAPATETAATATVDAATLRPTGPATSAAVAIPATRNGPTPAAPRSASDATPAAAIAATPPQASA